MIQDEFIIGTLLLFEVAWAYCNKIVRRSNSTENGSAIPEGRRPVGHPSYSREKQLQRLRE